MEAKGHSVKKHDQVIKEQDKARKRLAREDDLRRKEEKEKDAAARRLAREDENKRERDKQQNEEAMRKVREDDLRRKQEKEKDAAARCLAREDENKRERDRVKNQEAMLRGRRASAEGTAVNQEVVQQEQIQGTDSSVSEIIQSLRKNHFKSLDLNNFDTCLFSDNPLLESGKEMFKQLEEINWRTCSNCNETYICLAIAPRSGKCERCSRNSALFSN